MAARIRLGQLLVDMKLISQQQLDGALALQKQDPRRLGEILVDSGAVSESQVTQVLSQQLSVPWVSLQHIDFSRQLLNLVPAETAEKFGVVPIYVRRARNRQETLYVAMQDPSDEEPLKLISEFANLPVRSMIAPPTDIRAAIRAYYLGLPPEEELTANPVSLAPPPAASATEPVAIPGAPAVPETETDEPPESGPLHTRDAAMPKPSTGAKSPKMVTLTMLDGMTITLPAAGEKKGAEESAAGAGAMTARDLVEALRAQAAGADASTVLGEDVNWEKMFAALLSLLLKKHLIHDWEFVNELHKE